MKIRRTPLGCLSLTAILGMLVVLLVVVGFSLLRGGWLFSPGGLNAQPLVLPTQPATGVAQPLIIGGVTTHAQIADCATCHTPIWSRERMADACEACHIELVQNPKNFHKALFAQGQSQDCRTCHTEHHGAGGVLTLVSLTNFPHDTTGYSLIAHKTIKTGIPFKCSDCHQNYVVFDQAL